MKRTTVLIAGAVAAVALFGGGYAVGAQSPARAKAATAGNPSCVALQRGSGQSSAVPGAAIGAALLSGKVIAVNPDSITIESVARTADGSPAPVSTIALVGSVTRVVKITTQDTKVSELKAGDQVSVVGTTDPTTGTVSAQAVIVGGTNVTQLFAGGVTQAQAAEQSQCSGASATPPGQPAGNEQNNPIHGLIGPIMQKLPGHDSGGQGDGGAGH